MRRYYFDYAAGTPVDSRVIKAMAPYWSEIYGNPGALHYFGQKASAAVFKSREAMAKLLGGNYKEIIFTASATEANNLALRGIVRATKLNNPKIIVSAVEHESILETARDLSSGAAEKKLEAVYLPVSKNGIVDLEKLKKTLDERTVLVSVMYVNNEIGTIQPVKEIAGIIKKFRGDSVYPLFHTDAVQAFNYLDCDVRKLGVDLLTLSSQKIYGPKGIGMLYAREGIKGNLASVITGGASQEYGLRAGTENIPAIVGFAKAMEIADSLRNKETKRLGILQRYFLRKIKKNISGLELNGDSNSRVPNNLNFYFPGIDGQELLIKLDLAGFAVSSGAACSARTVKPSRVLSAAGFSEERAKNSLRITFGRPTTKPGLDLLLAAVKKSIS